MALAEVLYRVHMVESERGWGQDYFHRDFDTLESAENFMREVNSENTSLTAPDYYIQANSIETIVKE